VFAPQGIKMLLFTCCVHVVLILPIPLPTSHTILPMDITHLHFRSWTNKKGHWQQPLPWNVIGHTFVRRTIPKKINFKHFEFSYIFYFCALSEKWLSACFVTQPQIFDPPTWQPDLSTLSMDLSIPNPLCGVISFKSEWMCHLRTLMWRKHIQLWRGEYSQ